MTSPGRRRRNASPMAPRVRPDGPGVLALAFGQSLPQADVLGEIAAITGHSLRIAVEDVLVAADRPGDAHHRSVGLELGERRLEQLLCALSAHGRDQVDRHVVRRPEDDRVVCEKILAVAGITYDNATLLSIAPQDVIKALDDGTIDAVFRNFSPDSPILDALLKGPQYRLMSFAEAEALSRIFPYLVRVVLPRGAVDLARKLPVSDTALVATTNVLMARKDVHPAIVDLLAVAISQAHSMPGLFHKVGEFPTETDPEYPISQSARDFYKSGPSFLNRYLPFWMTSYAQRVIAVLLAVIAIVVPVFNYAPKLFLWLIHERVRRLYRRLRIVDNTLLSGPSTSQVQALHSELESIARAASIVPMRSSELFFDLRSHIDRTRTHLASAESRNRSSQSCLMSALGQKQTCAAHRLMSALHPEADIQQCDLNIR